MVLCFDNLEIKLQTVCNLTELKVTIIWWQSWSGYSLVNLIILSFSLWLKLSYLNAPLDFVLITRSIRSMKQWLLWSRLGKASILPWLPFCSEAMTEIVLMTKYCIKAWKHWENWEPAGTNSHMSSTGPQSRGEDLYLVGKSMIAWSQNPHPGRQQAGSNNIM